MKKYISLAIAFSLISSAQTQAPTSQISNAYQKENLDYLLDDSKSKFPVSDYVWQKERSNQNVSSYFNNKKRGVGQIQFLGYDGFGNAVYIDSENHLTDENGNLILDSNGNPIKFMRDRDGRGIYVDSSGRVVDSKGNPILDDMGKPITITKDDNGKNVRIDSNGNLVNYRGKTILDDKGKPIPAKKKQQSLKDQMLQEQKNIESKLKQNAQKESKRPARPTPTKQGNAKPTQKKQPPKNNIDMEVLFLEAMQEKNPLIDEYGDDDINTNTNYAAAMGLGNASNVLHYGNLFRDSYLGGRGNTQMQQESHAKYGDSSFSNQENIDEATNEHKLYRTITAGKLIPCILLTPINSEIEGLVSAQVEQDIYAHMGKAVLIPRGSKVIGFYKNDNDIGQSRLQIVWREIITPQGINILLTNAVVSDSEGYSGAKGHLNNRYWERYGMGITMQTLANALTFTIANTTQKENANSAATYYTGQILGQSQNDINSVLRQITQKQASIKPIIQIKAGSRIYITPTAHIWFPIPKQNETMARYFDENQQ